MDVPLRKLLFSVEDPEGRCVKNVLVRFYVNNKVVAEATTTCERPLEFSINAEVEIIDIEIFFGQIHEWLKVPMDSGVYTYKFPKPENSRKPGRNRIVWVTLTPLLLGAVLVVAAYRHEIWLKFYPVEYVQLQIAVIDLNNQRPVANAQVVIQDGDLRLGGKTDANGHAGSFGVAKNGPNAVEVMVNAPSFDASRISIARPPKDEIATVVLARHIDTAKKESDHPKFKLTGTWQVEAPDGQSADLTISSGSFIFSAPQQDGSVGVTAQFSVDKFTISLRGNCKINGPTAQMSFSADAGTANAWTGTGIFVFESPTKISGRLQNRRGDDTPFTLVKQATVLTHNPSTNDARISK